METAVIVFGASGRLGQALLPRLAKADLAPIAVARASEPGTPAPGVHWLQIDVTDERHCRRALPVLQRLASLYGRVVLVDLVLDRRSVSAMRDSTIDSTRYVCALGRRFSTGGHVVSYVLASTTAILAPWPLQTPYGLAKRRQLARYLCAAQPTAALLLPPLRPEAAQERDTLSWTFERAAGQLVVQAQHPRGSRLVAPAAVAVGTRSAMRWSELAGLHVASFLSERDSPLAHRRASHARLQLVPVRWRSNVDHHGAPDVLVQRAARRYQTAVQRVS